MNNQEAVLNAALPLFLRYGYRKTSMGDVARASGFSRQSIYTWYPNKKKLFIGVVRHTFQNIQVSYTSALNDPSKNLHERLVDAFAHFAGFIVNSDTSMSSMDELAEVASSFLGAFIVDFEQDFISAVASQLQEQRGHAPIQQAHVLLAVSRGLKYSAGSLEEYRSSMLIAMDLLLNPQT